MTQSWTVELYEQSTSRKIPFLAELRAIPWMLHALWPGCGDLLAQPAQQPSFDYTNGAWGIETALRARLRQRLVTYSNMMKPRRTTGSLGSDLRDRLRLIVAAANKEGSLCMGKNRRVGVLLGVVPVSHLPAVSL